MVETYFFREPGCVVLGDFARSIGALIIYKYVFPVRIRLAQDAFDAFGKVVLGIVERRDDADQRSGFHVISS